MRNSLVLNGSRVEITASRDIFLNSIIQIKITESIFRLIGFGFRHWLGLANKAGGINILALESAGISFDGKLAPAKSRLTKAALTAPSYSLGTSITFKHFFISAKNLFCVF